MRLILASLVAALVLAGCANNASPNATTTPPTTSTPSGSGNGTMGAMTEIVKDNHDFTGAGTPAGGATSKAFTIPAGYTMLNLTVKFSPAAGAPAGVASSISVKAAGLTCTLPDGPVTATVSCVKDGAASPGDAKIEYGGTGPVTANVVVSGG